MRLLELHEDSVCERESILNVNPFHNEHRAVLRKLHLKVTGTLVN